MNRRSMFRALVGASAVPAVSGSAKQGSEPPVYAFSQPEECAICSAATITLLPRWMTNPRSVIRCGSGEKCPNRWPWFQSATGQIRVPAELRRLLEVLERIGEAEDQGVWDHRNRIGQSAIPPDVRYAAIDRVREIARQRKGDVLALIEKELKKV